MTPQAFRGRTVAEPALCLKRVAVDEPERDSAAEEFGYRGSPSCAARRPGEESGRRSGF